jgi:cobalt/nickel transport system permease protein
MIVFDDGRPATIIHRLDPRVRVLAAAGWAGLLCACWSPLVLTIAIGSSLVLMFASRIVTPRTLRRLGALNLFMLGLVLILPLSFPGTPLWEAGGFQWSIEGLHRASLIAMKANAIVIAFFSLIGTMEPAHLGFALDKLGVPSKLTHLVLFMVRYVEVIHGEYHRLDDAMRVRGFRPAFTQHTLRTYGSLVGTMLVRSVDRAERIAEAMKCRGFQGRFYVLTSMRFAWPDAVFAVCAILSLAFLGFMEWSPAMR